MAGKFVDLKEAATMIGVAPDELIEMRSNGDIFGYRDGQSWKFKTEEVERVIRERGVEARSGGDSSILNANDDDFDNMITGLSSKILAEKAQEEPGSVLISEQELGVSAKGKSTIIGPTKGGKSEDKAGDSDLRLAGDSDKDLKGGSDKLLEAPGSVLEPTSASDVLHGSDIQPSGGSGTGDMPLPKGGSTGDLQMGDLSLSEDDDLEIGSSDSALDDEIRPKGSGKGSDITMGTGDSGINLSPADSGLSLEDEPLDLGGSAVESLELPEDDEMIGGEDLDAEPATQMKQDNEFLLSGGESLDEESSDSGSQVIALEDSESFDQDAATMVGTDQGAGLEMEFTPVGAEEGMELSAAPGVSQPVYVSMPAAEAPYSLWNVMSLGVVAGLLALAGMMMVDVMLNMWSFSGTNSVSTGIMDAFVGVLGKK